VEEVGEVGAVALRKVAPAAGVALPGRVEMVEVLATEVVDAEAAALNVAEGWNGSNGLKEWKTASKG
jgi:hypothetical protein